MAETLDVRRSVGIAVLVIGLGLLAMAAVASKSGRLKLRPGSPLKAGAAGKVAAPTLPDDLNVGAGPHTTGDARSASPTVTSPRNPATPSSLSDRPRAHSPTAYRSQSEPAPPSLAQDASPLRPRQSFSTDPVLTELGAATRLAWQNGKRGRLLAWDAEQRLRRLEREGRLPNRPPPRPTHELEAELSPSDLRRLADQELGRFIVEQIRSGRQGYALGESLAEQVRRLLQQRPAEESN